MTYRTGYHDGWLCIVADIYSWDRPEISRVYWPVEECPRSRCEHLIDLPAEATQRYGGGDYTVYVGHADTAAKWERTLRLRDGGSTQPIRTDFVPLPCPKVRKGTEVRWHHGRWQKYSKVHGWISA